MHCFVPRLCPTALHMLSTYPEPTDMGFIFSPGWNHTSGVTRLAKPTMPSPRLGIQHHPERIMASAEKGKLREKQILSSLLEHPHTLNLEAGRVQGKSQLRECGSFYKLFILLFNLLPVLGMEILRAPVQASWRAYPGSVYSPWL